MMTKSSLKVLRRSILVSSLVLFIFSNIFGQMHCRSELAGHLTPFSSKVPLLWAVEGTMAPGIISSRKEGEDPAKITGGMLLGALDFSFLKNNNFYIEGGYKNWSNSISTGKKNDKSRHLGVRQFFYGYKNDNTNVKIGLHETKLGDYFLIDERMLGTSIDQKLGAFNINFRGGTVLKNFARMGHFCANRHLYNLIKDDFTENIGKKAGETNLAGLVINWDPNYKKPKETKESEDEFGEFNEFSDMGDGGEFDEKKKLISNIGFIFYDEFGKIIPDNKFYFGSLIDFNLPSKFTFQTGAVYQSMSKNNALVYIASLGRSITWNSGAYTKFNAAYIGKYNIDENALFQPLFSNMFLGEVMRMDAVDFPLWRASVKQKFPGKLKFDITLKAVGQIENNKTNEIDIESSLKPWKHIKITTILSRVETNAIPNNIFMGRLEIRAAF